MISAATDPTTAAAPSARLRPPDPARPKAVVPEPPRPLHVTIDGELVNDAEMRLERGTNRPTVSLLIAQGASAPPLRVIEVFGDGHDAAEAATAKAFTLRAGRRVRITGQGLGIRWNRGEFSLTVGLVERVALLSEGGAP